MFLKLLVNLRMAYPRLKLVILLNKIEFICVYADINFFVFRNLSCGKEYVVQSTIFWTAY